MGEDFSNLRNLKKPLSEVTDKVCNSKQTTTPKSGKVIRFIITKTKNNSLVDDFHTQESLNRLKNVYH